MLALPLLLLLPDNECIHSVQSARCKCQKCRQVNHLIHLSISGQWTGSALGKQIVSCAVWLI